MSSGLAVVVVALFIGLFARNKDSNVVLIYPALGNEDKVVITLGDQELDMDYDSQKNVYIKRLQKPL